MELAVVCLLYQIHADEQCEDEGQEHVHVKADRLCPAPATEPVFQFPCEALFLSFFYPNVGHDLQFMTKKAKS